jgi:hypothetical protein
MLGIDRIIARIRGDGDDLPRRLDRAGQVLAAAMKQECPVRTGQLQKSIQSVPTGRGVEVRATVPYAEFVVRGWTSSRGKEVPPNDFPGRAAAKVRDQVRKIIAGQ